LTAMKMLLSCSAVLLALCACSDTSRSGPGADAGAVGSSGRGSQASAKSTADASTHVPATDASTMPHARSHDADVALPSPSHDAGVPSDAATRAVGARSSRHFRLATSGAQLLVTGPELGLQLTPANVIEDSDVVAVHQEFYGLPWDAFEAGTAPPPEWVALMDRFAKAASDANKPVFLSISMLNGKRESLAAKTKIENGAVKTQDDWSVKCYDFASATDRDAKKAAYLRYVAYMVDKFHPVYLNLAIEVNLFFEKCPSATAGLIDVINAGYDAVKVQRSETLVFPSFQIDHLYGYSTDSCANATARDACFDKLYAVLTPIKRDRFAISSYPYMQGMSKPADLPADWFTRGAARGGEKPLIAETGWPSTGITVRAKDGTCPAYFSFDEPTSAAYLTRVLADADEKGLELVTWWSDRDLLVSKIMTNCPCDFDATWCSVLDIFRGPPTIGTFDTQLFGELALKVFGTMGLRNYDGTPKPAHTTAWNAARSRPYAP
jgi:hypothetical protein